VTLWTVSYLNENTLDDLFSYGLLLMYLQMVVNLLPVEYILFSICVLVFMPRGPAIGNV